MNFEARSHLFCGLSELLSGCLGAGVRASTPRLSRL